MTDRKRPIDLEVLHRLVTEHEAAEEYLGHTVYGLLTDREDGDEEAQIAAALARLEKRGLVYRVEVWRETRAGRAADLRRERMRAKR